MISLKNTSCHFAWARYLHWRSSISNHYRLMFALKIICGSFFNMAMALRTCAASKIIVYECMNPSPRCAILFKYAQLRCALLSCAKRGDLVRESHNAVRNRCDATCWRDYLGDQAHSVRR